MIGAAAVVSQAMVDQLKAFFGLDQPWYVQYVKWVGRLSHGDLGTSWRTGKPVILLILERLPVTLELTTLSVGFALLIGMPAGILSAIPRDPPGRPVTPGGAPPRLPRPRFWPGRTATLFFLLY